MTELMDSAFLMISGSKSFGYDARLQPLNTSELFHRLYSSEVRFLILNAVYFPVVLCNLPFDINVYTSLGSWLQELSQWFLFMFLIAKLNKNAFVERTSGSTELNKNWHTKLDNGWGPKETWLQRAADVFSLRTIWLGVITALQVGICCLCCSLTVGRISSDYSGEVSVLTRIKILEGIILQFRLHTILMPFPIKSFYVYVQERIVFGLCHTGNADLKKWIEEYFFFFYFLKGFIHNWLYFLHTHGTIFQWRNLHQVYFLEMILS